MKLFLVRHAHALADEQDAQRPLSARGREVTRLAAAFFRANGLLATVHAVWHSPLRRARETAEVLVKELGLEAPLVETAGLLPSDDPAVMADRLEHVDRAVLIVGHEPHLGSLASARTRSPAPSWPPSWCGARSSRLPLTSKKARWWRLRRLAGATRRATARGGTSAGIFLPSCSPAEGIETGQSPPLIQVV